MKNSVFLYINYLKKMVRSPLRMILTLSGLTLAIIILMSGLIFSETYYAYKLAEIKSYKDNNAIVVDGAYDFEIYEQVSSLENRDRFIELEGANFYKAKEIKIDNYTIPIFVKEIRVNEFNQKFIKKIDNITSRHKTDLMFGRLIDEEDIEYKSKVAVVDENFAEIVYGSKDVVGQIITLPIYKVNPENSFMEISYYEKLEIIGVVKSNDKITLNEDEIKEKFLKGENVYEFYIYTPLTLKIDEKENEEYTMRITTFSKDENYKKNISKVEEYLANYSSHNNYESYNYYNLKSRVDSEIHDLRQMILYVVIFLFFIASISIINTMLFSIKERINEIGIRKAIGAFNENIIVQFLFEGSIYGFLASIIGVVISILTASLIFVLINGYEKWNTYLVVSLNSIVIAVLTSFLIGIIASIIPAFYASKIKITNAIKYD